MSDSHAKNPPLPSGVSSAATRVVELDASDLPAFCPSRHMSAWDAHPRVFLDMAHGGHARCPYCSTEYRLKPGVSAGSH